MVLRKARMLVAAFSLGCGDAESPPELQAEGSSGEPDSTSGGTNVLPTTSSESSTSLASSGDTTGDESVTDDTSGGGGLSPSAWCEDYLACVAATHPRTLGPLIDAYGPEGSCWQSTQELADQCNMACEVGFNELAPFHEDVPACGGREMPEESTGSDGGTTWESACGDGVVEPGEQCDGDDVQGLTCEALDLGAGQLLCDPVTCTFDTTACAG